MPPVVSTAAIARHADRVAILLNPKAGPKAARPRAKRLAELLDRRNFKVELFTDPAEAAAWANRRHADRTLRALVGVGGDGTAAELINLADDGVPLCFLPAGNSNLLAGYLRLGKDPKTLCRTIAGGLIARLDAGEANGRLFALMASCGFDADVVRRVHRRRTGHISLRSYAKPILESIGSYEYPEIRIQWDERDRFGPPSARWLFVFNLPCYGGGFRIAPGADGSDGLLDACCFRRGRLWPGLWYTAAVLVGGHHRLSDCTAGRTRRLRITADGEAPYQLDGDPAGLLPLDIRVLPGRLTFVVPPGAVKNTGISESQQQKLTKTQ